MVKVKTAINWKKSSFSGAGNDCVELEPGFTMIRDSKNEKVLNLSRGSIFSFVSSVKK